MPVCRAAVLAAQPALLALADDLVEVRDPSPRGVALALRLLVRRRRPAVSPVGARRAARGRRGGAPRALMPRGRHKVFLGMAAGVGKTYRMLQEGRGRWA